MMPAAFARTAFIAALPVLLAACDSTEEAPVAPAPVASTRLSFVMLAGPTYRPPHTGMVGQGRAFERALMLKVDLRPTGMADSGPRRTTLCGRGQITGA